MGANRRDALENAKMNNDDEFYTQMCDIEDELHYYPDVFRGKTVLCNCDDPRESNFFIYFAQFFKKLGLKKLITTCYKNIDPDNFSKKDSEKAIALVYTGSEDDRFNPEDVQIIPLKGDGDFRSDECIEFLKESDIVVTNPPFSLLKEFIPLLEQYNKKYLLVVSNICCQYSSVFPLIARCKTWRGATRRAGNMKFERRTGIIHDHDTAELKTVAAYWLTNIENNLPFEKVIMHSKYYGNEDKYPKFDKFDAICVDSINDIPDDYYDVMGVPVTILSKNWMEEFEIVTFREDKNGNHVIYSLTDDKVSDAKYPYVKAEELKQIIACDGILNSGSQLYVNGKKKFSRMLIRRRPKSYKINKLRQDVADISTGFIKTRKQTLDELENMRVIFNEKLHREEDLTKSELMKKLTDILYDHGGKIDVYEILNEYERIDYITADIIGANDVATVHTSFDNTGFICMTDREYCEHKTEIISKDTSSLGRIHFILNKVITLI